MLVYSACAIVCAICPPVTPPILAHNSVLFRPALRCRRYAAARCLSEDDNSGEAMPQPWKPNLATDVDDVQMFGAMGGGVLTREAFLNANKNINPVSIAEERLQKVVAEAGTVPPAAAVSMLKLEINAALVAGVFESAPQLRKARQLLSAIELAAANESALDKDDGVEEDPLASKLDILFTQGFEFDLPDEL
eukprot:scaffold188728_cov31-Tisochrysis_lutea.AAC.1